MIQSSTYAGPLFANMQHPSVCSDLISDRDSSALNDLWLAFVHQAMSCSQQR
jgi:hypothetical protein